MSDWFESLPGLWEAGWEALSEKGEVVLATVSPSGWPEARSVILRRADREAARCEVHTDAGSGKIGSLDACPRAALHLWRPEIALQLRLSAEVRILTGDATRAAWDEVPDRSQTAYGKRPAPGTPIAEALAYELTPGPEAFAILSLEVQEVDALHLGAQHRRARFDRGSGWRGPWLAP